MFKIKGIDLFQMMSTHSKWSKLINNEVKQCVEYDMPYNVSYLLQTELPLDCPPLCPLVLSK